MVETMLRTVDPNVPFAAVHASHGKVARAEPVAALYEQGRVHHLGAFAALEDQMCAFSAGADGHFDRDRVGYSPDRVDALVWALTELFLQPKAGQPRHCRRALRASFVPFVVKSWFSCRCLAASL